MIGCLASSSNLTILKVGIRPIVLRISSQEMQQIKFKIDLRMGDATSTVIDEVVRGLLVLLSQFTVAKLWQLANIMQSLYKVLYLIDINISLSLFNQFNQRGQYLIAYSVYPKCSSFSLSYPDYECHNCPEAFVRRSFLPPQFMTIISCSLNYLDSAPIIAIINLRVRFEVCYLKHLIGQLICSEEHFIHRSCDCTLSRCRRVPYQCRALPSQSSIAVITQQSLIKFNDPAALFISLGKERLKLRCSKILVPLEKVTLSLFKIIVSCFSSIIYVIKQFLEFHHSEQAVSIYFSKSSLSVIWLYIPASLLF